MTQQPPKKSSLRTPMMTRTAAAARRNQSQNNRYNQHSNGNHGNHQVQSRSAIKNRINPRDAFDKYSNMAKEALAQDDKVLAENYYQHADHYYRIMLENRQKETVAQNNEQIKQPQLHPKVPRPAVKMPTQQTSATYNQLNSVQSSGQPTFEQVNGIQSPPMFLQQETSEKIQTPPEVSETTEQDKP